MPSTVSIDSVLIMVGEAATNKRDEPAAKFGKCKMCSCPRYTTSEDDWQFCDCGHSRSAHQH
jgi:hypothetical protein